MGPACRRIVFTLPLLVACGGGPKHDSTPAPPAAAEAGTTTAAAGCEPGRCLEDISHVIEGHRAAARACYDAGLVRQPGLKGRIIINFEIDAAGVVAEASQGVQDNQITESGVVACVTDVIKHVEFAKSARGKTTRGYHHFDFSPH
jgi:hypothetical protein